MCVELTRPDPVLPIAWTLFMTKRAQFCDVTRLCMDHKVLCQLIFEVTFIISQRHVVKQSGMSEAI